MEVMEALSIISTPYTLSAMDNDTYHRNSNNASKTIYN